MKVFFEMVTLEKSPDQGAKSTMLSPPRASRVAEMMVLLVKVELGAWKTTMPPSVASWTTLLKTLEAPQAMDMPSAHSLPATPASRRLEGVAEGALPEGPNCEFLTTNARQESWSPSMAWNADQVRGSEGGRSVRVRSRRRRTM